MKTQFLTLLILPFFLSACATPVTHSTPSGKPEVTISGVSKSTVKDALTDMMMDNQYTLTTSSESMLIFDRPIENSAMAYMFSSKLNRNPTFRVSYNVASTKKGIRVIADYNAVSNPGSGYENKTSLIGHPNTKNIQYELNALKNEMEGQK